MRTVLTLNGHKIHSAPCHRIDTGMRLLYTGITIRHTQPQDATPGCTDNGAVRHGKIHGMQKTVARSRILIPVAPGTIPPLDDAHGSIHRQTVLS